MLSNPNRYWKSEQLAKEARVSTGHVYNIKEELLNREWAHFDNKGLNLNEPENLLQEWCKEYQTEDKPYFSFYSLLTPSEFEARIQKTCNDLKMRYALSGLAGAFRLAPFVRYHRVTFYLEDKVNELVKKMDLKSVTSGENVTIITPSNGKPLLPNGIAESRFHFCSTRDVSIQRIVLTILAWCDLFS